MADETTPLAFTQIAQDLQVLVSSLDSLYPPGTVHAARRPSVQFLQGVVTVLVGAFLREESEEPKRALERQAWWHSLQGLRLVMGVLSVSDREQRIKIGSQLQVLANQYVGQLPSAVEEEE